MSAPARTAELSPAKRREGFLVGAVIGASLAAATAGENDLAGIRSTLSPDGIPQPLAPPPGRRRAATALADGLLEELLAGGVDLHRLAHRWGEWWSSDGCDADPRLAEALDHLREFDAPVDQLHGTGVAPLAAAIPAALASASPRAMIAGAMHVARLIDPSEDTGLAAVSVVVAAATLLDGRRDVIPEVLSMLRANDAPESLWNAVQEVPRNPRQPPAAPRGNNDPVQLLAWLLWVVEYQPRSVEALRMMVLTGGVSTSVGAVLGALLGARDGLASWPVEWLVESGEEVALRTALARQLSGE